MGIFIVHSVLRGYTNKNRDIPGSKTHPYAREISTNSFGCSPTLTRYPPGKIQTCFVLFHRPGKFSCKCFYRNVSNIMLDGPGATRDNRTHLDNPKILIIHGFYRGTQGPQMCSGTKDVPSGKRLHSHSYENHHL
jgi:hypothetical protein